MNQTRSGGEPVSVSNLPIFGLICHPIFVHKRIKKAAEAAILLYNLFIHPAHLIIRTCYVVKYSF